MDPSIESKLIECLDLLQQGQSVEQILRRYPQEREQLRPLLETAEKVSNFNLQPTMAAQSRSRQAFLAEAEALRQRSGSRPPRFAGLQRLLLPVMALVMLFFFGAGLFTLSASTLPGDSLYGAKRLVESLQLALITDVSQREELTEQFRQARIDEIQQLLAAGREADVEFSGKIQRIEDDRWLIAGLNTQVNAATQITGPSQVGNSAAVIGRVSAGTLTATSIAITAVPVPPPSATDPVTPTPTVEVPTATPTAEAVEDTEAVPTATATPRPPTATPEPKATMTPEPTATATEPSAPTVVPVNDVDDNSSDDVEDNSSDDVDGNSNDDSENENNGDDSSNDGGDGNSNDVGDDNSNDNDDDHSDDGDNSNDTSEDDNSNDGQDDDGGSDDSNDNGNSGSSEEENSNDSDSDNSNDSSGSGSGGDDDSEDDLSNDNDED